jgi:hypothetical protein
VTSTCYSLRYSACCQNSNSNSNYNPTASTEECKYYNACSHSGNFVAIGRRSLDLCKSTVPDSSFPFEMCFLSLSPFVSFSLLAMI